MAQPMTGRDSTPRAISNAPISIFAKEEKKMTRKPAADTTEQVVETTATVEPVAVSAPVQSVASDDLSYLVAQRKALSEQIKAAKAAAKAAKAQPEATKNAVSAITKRVQARVKAGQTQDDAIAEVFALYRTAVEAALTTTSSTTE